MMEMLFCCIVHILHVFSIHKSEYFAKTSRIVRDKCQILGKCWINHWETLHHISKFLRNKWFDKNLMCRMIYYREFKLAVRDKRYLGVVYSSKKCWEWKYYKVFVSSCNQCQFEAEMCNHWLLITMNTSKPFKSFQCVQSYTLKPQDWHFCSIVAIFQL